jgi:hypothetical protein
MNFDLNPIGIKTESHKRFYWKSFQRRRDSHLVWARRTILKALSVQFKGWAKHFSEVSTPQEMLNYEINPEPMEKAYTELYRRVGGDFALSTFRGLKSSGHYRLKTITESDYRDYIENWLRTVAADRVVGVNHVTVGKIRSVLDKAISQGMGIAETSRIMSREISGISRIRSERIARTEIVAASNKGALVSAEATGLTLKKSWLSTRDDRTRESHVDADGQTKALAEPFLVDGEQMEAPGDPSASPGLVINCRCTVIFEQISESQDIIEDSQSIEQEYLSQNNQSNIVDAKLNSEEARSFLNQQNFEYIDGRDGDEVLTNRLRTVQNTIAEEQGFNGRATIIDDDEFIRLANNKDEYIHMYRGVDSPEFIDQYYSGDAFASSHNLYGNGTYYASSNQYDVAKFFAKGEDSNVFSAVVQKSNMKIGDFARLREQWENDRNKYDNNLIKEIQTRFGRTDIFSSDFQMQYPEVMKDYENKSKTFNDFGTWATASGYDAYYVNLPSSLAGFTGTNSEYYVLLNRTKAILPRTLRGKL